MTKYSYTPRRPLENENGYVATIKGLSIAGIVIGAFCFCMYSQSKFYDSITQQNKESEKIISTNNLEEVLNE